MKIYRNKERDEAALVHGIWARLAEREGVTVDAVRREIEAAMLAAEAKSGKNAAFSTPEAFYLDALKKSLGAK